MVASRACADFANRGLGHAVIDRVTSPRRAPSRRRLGPADVVSDIYVENRSGTLELCAFGWNSAHGGEVEVTMRARCDSRDAEQTLDHFFRWLIETSDTTLNGPFGP